MTKLLKASQFTSVIVMALFNITNAQADAQFDLNLSGTLDGNPIPPKAQVLVQNGKVRLAFPNAPDYQEVIYDSATSQFAIVDNNVKDVRYVDANTLGDLASKAQQAAKDLGVEINIGNINDMLAGIGQSKPQTNSRASGEFATIANAQCEWYVFTAQDQQDRGCLVKSEQLTFLSSEDRSALNHMGQTARSIGSQVSGILGNEPALRVMTELGSNQLPLSWQGTGSGLSFEVRAMESKELPSGIADIPSSYKTSPLL